MKDLFKHASSSWVKYDRYEWKKDKNNKFYITPAPNAMPKIYDPLKEYQQMVLDALNVGLMIRTSSKRKIREAIMEFVTKYGLLGLMTALPTTPSFIDYKAVYLPTNHFLREEVMDTQKYLFYFFPFEKPDFFKNGKDSLWNINGDRTMIALAMTFRKEPEAQVMCFMRNYAERYDWLEQTFQDWSFTFLSSFLFMRMMRKWTKTSVTFTIRAWRRLEESHRTTTSSYGSGPPLCGIFIPCFWQFR